jgi:hypothetical protein
MTFTESKFCITPLAAHVEDDAVVPAVVRTRHALSQPTKATTNTWVPVSHVG